MNPREKAAETYCDAIQLAKRLHPGHPDVLVLAAIVSAHVSMTEGAKQYAEARAEGVAFIANFTEMWRPEEREAMIECMREMLALLEAPNADRPHQDSTDY